MRFFCCTIPKSELPNTQSISHRKNFRLNQKEIPIAHKNFSLAPKKFPDCKNSTISNTETKIHPHIPRTSPAQSGFISSKPPNLCLGFISVNPPRKFSVSTSDKKQSLNQHAIFLCIKPVLQAFQREVQALLTSISPHKSPKCVEKYYNAPIKACISWNYSP